MSEKILQKGKLNIQHNSYRIQNTENITVIHTEALSDSCSTEKWTHINIMCLLEILWEEFDRLSSASSSSVSQREIFERASKEMKKNGFFFTKEELKRKYKSLILKYLNIKSQSFGKQINHSWNYFEIVSEVYKMEKNTPLRFKMRNEFRQSRSNLKTSKPIHNLRPKLPVTPSTGAFISNSDDLRSFTTQWEAKQFANEDYKLKLLETLFDDLSSQRDDAEKDTCIHIKMRNEKLKYLRHIIEEMNEFRVNLRSEFSSLTDMINEIVAALKNT